MPFHFSERFRQIQSLLAFFYVFFFLFFKYLLNCNVNVSSLIKKKKQKSPGQGLIVLHAYLWIVHVRAPVCKKKKNVKNETKKTDGNSKENNHIYHR